MSAAYETGSIARLRKSPLVRAIGVTVIALVMAVLAWPDPSDAGRRKRPVQSEPNSEAQGSVTLPVRKPEQAGAVKGEARNGPPKGAKDEPAGGPPAPKTWTPEERIAALEACVALLAATRVKVEIAPPAREGECGAPAFVELRSIGTEPALTLSPPVVVNCKIAARFATWVADTLQPVSREMIGAPVVRITGGGGYSCRNRIGGSGGKISEHAFGNAIDIPGFVFADGRRISVLKDWGPTARDPKPAPSAPAPSTEAKPGAAKGDGRIDKKGEAAGGQVELPTRNPERVAEEQPRRSRRARRRSRRSRRPRTPPKPAEPTTGPQNAASDELPRPKAAEYLRRLHKAACGPFTTVLGPEANEAHRNHFHFDLVARRRGAYCQ